MKSESRSRIILFLFCALAPLLPAAGQQYWDPDGLTPGSTVPGNWDTVTTNWTANPDSGTNTVWTQGSDASFIITNNLTVTLTEPITTVNVTVSGTNGTLTLARTARNTLPLGGSTTLNPRG